jgi:hypothetical protein
VNYIIRVIDVSVLERRVYKTYLLRARANSLTARNVIRRAEQRRFTRLRANPTTIALHVIVRDIRDVVKDLILDLTIIN